MVIRHCIRHVESAPLGSSRASMRVFHPSPSKPPSLAILTTPTGVYGAASIAKEKLVKLLEEQRQALVNEAVTGQIDVQTGKPYPTYKDSGVEWLGGVPEHWEVVPLRRVALSRCDGPFGSGLKSSHYAEEGIRVVRTSEYWTRGV